MPKKLAIDWDETEIRLVAAHCNGGKVNVTDAAVIPIQDGSVHRTLRDAITERGLEKVETMVAIGRGKAELRELQLPPVPDEELPEMVRFQAIRSFASAGDSATVDYLVTTRSNQNVQVIAAAVTPQKLKEVAETCADADLRARRVALRPLAAAALYLTDHRHSQDGDTVLIDLLADDAEIVVARDGHVIFMRTVRMPTNSPSRPGTLAAELKRSLVACGSRGKPMRVVIWGREAVHREDVQKIAESTGSPVTVMDPFDLVEIDRHIKDDLPEHVGRLAPLVGLLVNDETHPERLIDFLNPRQRTEPKPDHRRTALLIGVPLAAALLLGFTVYRRLHSLDGKIVQLELHNANLTEPVKRAEESILRTERVDGFLDGDMNWLAELRSLAEKMPPSDEMMLRSISGTTNPRSNVGTLALSGSVTHPSVIDKFEDAVRDEHHQVVGSGANAESSSDAYRWAFNEKVSIPPEYVHELRYERILQAIEAGGLSAADGLPAAPDDKDSPQLTPATSADQEEQR